MPNDAIQNVSLLQKIASNQTVLVVEDDISANELAVTFLKKFYKTVDSAENGTIGLELFKQNRYDIVVTDINMPKMSGLELSKHIRAISPDQKIIIMTAHNDTDFMQDAIRIGVNEYMFKPIDYSDFLIILYRISKQIENEKLQIEQSKLASVGEMVSMIAHQWRQPLSIVQLLLDSIEYDIETKQIEFTKEYINDAKQQINFMSLTIDDFRYFFHKGENEEFDVNDALNTAISLCNAQLKSYAIKLNTKSETIKIFGNKNQITHAILVLIHNAKELLLTNECKDKEINISLKQENDQLIFKISDNSINKQLFNINEMFDPILNVVNSYKCKGLGLYIAKTVVEKNFNGKIIASLLPTGIFEACFILPIKKESN